MTINCFTYITSNKNLNFYIAKISTGWFAFAREKGFVKEFDPNNPDERSIGEFATRSAAITACRHWARYTNF